jgi:hypothetical protein
LIVVDRACDDLARDANQLLLVFYQAQSNLRLCDLAVTLDGLLLTLEFLIAQVPERQDDRSKKKYDGDKRSERGEAVLTRRRLPAPPPTKQFFGPRPRRTRNGYSLVGGMHRAIIKVWLARPAGRVGGIP